MSIKDIKKQIEEAAKKYADFQYEDSDDRMSILYDETMRDYIQGANFILSKWQETERWRKFATDGLPRIGQQIVCKRGEGYHLAKPASHDGIHWLAEHFEEWKPIS